MNKLQDYETQLQNDSNQVLLSSSSSISVGYAVGDSLAQSQTFPMLKSATPEKAQAVLGYLRCAHCRFTKY